MATNCRQRTDDPFLLRYDESELRIASEFLANWLPFLSKGLCQRCTENLYDRILSLSPSASSNAVEEPGYSGEDGCNVTTNDIDKCDTHSLGSWKDETETNSLGSWKDDGANGSPEFTAAGILSVESTSRRGRMSWADMAQEEDELEAAEEGEGGVCKQSDEANGPNKELGAVPRKKPELSREQREYIRFMNVKRKKDFDCFERVNGKVVNILQGLELHTGVFSAAEQKRIVDTVYELQEKGSKGELKDRTYTAPRKWMRGKGRQTIQFGCCYNYATDKKGNPPGILRNDLVDPLPPLFKVIIRRLIRWHVLPPSCVPDSCIVNIYEEEDCIPPHVDNHDFVRPFCTISFLSECNIVFGTNLKILGPGEFSGAHAIPLPVGSVLVLNGNGADVAKHCVPAVPSKRISITFRKMDESKRPYGFVPEQDLQGIEPLCYEAETSSDSTLTPHRTPNRQQTTGKGFNSDSKRSSYRHVQRSGWGPRPRVNHGSRYE